MQFIFKPSGQSHDKVAAYQTLNLRLKKFHIMKNRYPHKNRTCIFKLLLISLLIAACGKQNNRVCESTINTNNTVANKQIIAKGKMTTDTPDIQNPQVMIEALLVEIDQTESQSVGVQWITSPSAKENGKLKDVSTQNRASVGKLNDTTTTGNQMVPSITQLANMLSNNNAGNILAH